MKKSRSTASNIGVTTLREKSKQSRVDPNDVSSQQLKKNPSAYFPTKNDFNLTKTPFTIGATNLQAQQNLESAYSSSKILNELKRAQQTDMKYNPPNQQFQSKDSGTLRNTLRSPANYNTVSTTDSFPRPSSQNYRSANYSPERIDTSNVKKKLNNPSPQLFQQQTTQKPSSSTSRVDNYASLNNLKAQTMRITTANKNASGSVPISTKNVFQKPNFAQTLSKNASLDALRTVPDSNFNININNNFNNNNININIINQNIHHPNTGYIVKPKRQGNDPNDANSFTSGQLLPGMQGTYQPADIIESLADKSEGNKYNDRKFFSNTSNNPLQMSLDRPLNQSQSKTKLGERTLRQASPVVSSSYNRNPADAGPIPRPMDMISSINALAQTSSAPNTTTGASGTTKVPGSPFFGAAPMDQARNSRIVTQTGKLAGGNRKGPASGARRQENIKSTSGQHWRPSSRSMSPVKHELLDFAIPDPVSKTAFKTRTGYIPSKPQKTNQDSYIIMKNFCNLKGAWLFGVCDGHGLNGHFASDHVKKYLPTNIELIEYMTQKGGSFMNTKSDSKSGPFHRSGSQKPAGVGNHSHLNYSSNLAKSNNDIPCIDYLDSSDDSAEMTTVNGTQGKSFLLSKNKKKKYQIIAEGFLKTNADLTNRSFDVHYSGSTTVTVMVTGKSLVCANVGDSRAILGSHRPSVEVNKSGSNIKTTPKKGKDDDGKETYEDRKFDHIFNENGKSWVATALSRDHKPDEKDEHSRIMQSNGRVEPFREANGDPIGPHRVWLKNDNVPGLAMSRSLGDAIAAQVGVIAEPEFFETTLNEHDKFLVLASDGVWEFLSNEQVMNIVIPFWSQNNPEGACEKIVKESVANWKKEDEVIDDITCIVVFLNVKS